MKKLLFILISSSLFASGSLTVQGDIKLQKPADEIAFTVGLVTEAATAEKALVDNNKKMQGIIDQIVATGLTSSEYKTGRFSVQPLYSSPPADPPPYWRPSIYGYQVSNTVEVTTSKMELAGDVIDAATQAGANQVENIRFNLVDPRVHRTEAINKATANAIEDARALSRAANVKLVKINKLSLDESQTISPVLRGTYLKAARASIPIEPKDVDVTARVTLTWEVENE